MNLLLVKTLFWVIMRMNLLIKKSGQLRFYVEEKKDPRSQTEDQGWETFSSPSKTFLRTRFL